MKDSMTWKNREIRSGQQPPDHHMPKSPQLRPHNRARSPSPVIRPVSATRLSPHSTELLVELSVQLLESDEDILQRLVVPDAAFEGLRSFVLQPDGISSASFSTLMHLLFLVRDILPALGVLGLLGGSRGLLGPLRHGDSGVRCARGGELALFV